METKKSILFESIAPDSAEAILIADKLADFNRQKMGTRNVQPLCFTARNADGEIIGGVLAECIWGWLLIHKIWFDEAYRGQGLGRALFQQLEAAAIELDCQHASLETFSFQALAFYTRLGYEVVGQLDDFPVGQTRYSLRKKLLGSVHTDDAVGRATETIKNAPIQTTVKADTGYLEMLHQVTLDMLNHRHFEELIQVIVDHAATMLRAPLAELMLLEGEELVTVAFTANQAHLQGDRVKRGQSLVAWRALDSGTPALLDDYAQWEGKRSVYNANMPRAIADFPVRIGRRSIGVLALGRLQENVPFIEAEVALGMQFSDLIALVIDHAKREQNALIELEKRKKVEAQLLQQNSELDAYARTVAHDLKTPLTTLVGMARILQSGINLPDAAKTNATETIYRTALKMNQIIQALLSLSQNRLGIKVVIAETKPSEVAHEAKERLVLLLQNSHAKLHIADELPAVQAHAAWLEEIFANLISNAIKYGGKPAHIEIGGEQQGDQVKLWVRDFGPGISVSKRSQLFVEFSRLGIDVSDPDSIEGHGLGLSIVKRLAEAMEGKVGVDHPIDGGASFWIMLKSL